MKIKSFTNSIFSSRSYVLYDEQVGSAWLVDAGDVEPVVEFLRGAGLSMDFSAIFGIANNINND